MDIIIVIGGVFVCVASLITYILIHIYAPEWIGMTGKTARKNMDEQKNNPQEEPKKVKDFFSQE